MILVKDKKYFNFQESSKNPIQSSTIFKKLFDSNNISVYTENQYTEIHIQLLRILILFNLEDQTTLQIKKIDSFKKQQIDFYTTKNDYEKN